MSSVFLSFFSGLGIWHGDGLHIVLVSIGAWKSKTTGMRVASVCYFIEETEFWGKTRFQERGIAVDKGGGFDYNLALWRVRRISKTGIKMYMGKTV